MVVKVVSVELRYAQHGEIRLQSIGFRGPNDEWFDLNCYDEKGGQSVMRFPVAALPAIAAAATFAMAKTQETAFRNELLALLKKAATP